MNVNTHGSPYFGQQKQEQITLKSSKVGDMGAPVNETPINQRTCRRKLIRVQCVSLTTLKGPDFCERVWRHLFETPKLNPKA